MNLLQFLQKKGYSRRKILDALLRGEILINQQKGKNLKESLEIGDSVVYLGIHYKIENQDLQEKDQILILFNKPKGVVVSKSDPHNKTIYEILPEDFKNFYYIGRLDRESRGLLLLTNSSQLVHEYEHPSFGHTKEYLITLTEKVNAQNLQKMKEGIVDEGEKLLFKDIVLIAERNKHYIYKVILNEGKKRHIRRVIKCLGYHLIDLQRVKEEKRELGNLKEGEWKIIDL